MVKFLIPGWFLLRKYCYFLRIQCLIFDSGFALISSHAHNLTVGKTHFTTIYLHKNFYVVYCRSLVSNPARLSILTAYEIDPGYRSSVMWVISVSLPKGVPWISSPPWKRKVNDILSAVKASTQTLKTVTLIWGWFQTSYEVQRGSKQWLLPHLHPWTAFYSQRSKLWDDYQENRELSTKYRATETLVL